MNEGLSAFGADVVNAASFGGQRSTMNLPEDCMMLKRRFGATCFGLALTVVAACSEDVDPGGPRRSSPQDELDAGADSSSSNEMPGVPFEPVGPYVYVPKVKNVLTGLAATDDEIQAVVKDPNALRGLIDQWMTLPSFKVRILDFFRNAFQQNQFDFQTLLNNLNIHFDVSEAAQPRLARNIMDSFPLTVWKLIEEGRPFTEALTTRRYMMTTALLSTLGYIEDNPASDTGQRTNRLTVRKAIAKYTFDRLSTVPPEESANPASPNYMMWRFPGAQPAGCAKTSITFDASAGTDYAYYDRLFSFFMGKGPFNACNELTPPYLRYDTVFGDSDWNDWRMVTLHVDPAASGMSPAFFELNKLRTASEAVLRTDRVGFYGTIAFAANWGTNVTNEARVTANQSLIVALGQSIAGEGVIASFPVNATDADHASNPACKACHDQLDPFKAFFRQSYTLYYGDQTDPKQISQPAGFGIAGSNATGKGVGDLAAILMANPRFPMAWVTKLNFWANSTPALETDPEVLRVADVFKTSNYDFKTLIRELFSSPLITWAGPTQTTKTNGVIVSIARRDQFCAALSYRLGVDDVCGSLSIKRTSQQQDISTRALLMPVDTYYRSMALPALPTNSDLFYRLSAESICQLVSDQVVDVKTPTPSKYASTDPQTAIQDFVTTVMALVPSDPKAPKALAILQDNYDKAIASGAKPTAALKATFTLACLAPSSVIVGL